MVLGERSGAVRKSSVSFVTPPKRSKRAENDSVTTPILGDLGGWWSKLVSIARSYWGIGVSIWSCRFYGTLFIGQDEVGGATFSPQDWMELGLRLVSEVETRTSMAIQSGKFVKCVCFGRMLSG